MDAEFWLGRWQQGQIGWHQSAVHPLLERHWHGLGVAADARVFVPLCGKSLDMRWLRARGHTVVGVDLSPLAAAAFFEEIGQHPRVDRSGAFECWSADGQDILIGDFFALTPAQLGPVAALYDRAAMIALPPLQRARYRAHLAGLLPAGSMGLLIALEYEQERVAGPPFSVEAAEVASGLAPDFEVDDIERLASPADNPRFRDAGVDRWTEVVYRLRRRPPTRRTFSAAANRP